jgi:hypothetical protein
LQGIRSIYIAPTSLLPSPSPEFTHRAAARVQLVETVKKWPCARLSATPTLSFGFDVVGFGAFFKGAWHTLAATAAAAAAAAAAASVVAAAEDAVCTRC